MLLENFTVDIVQLWFVQMSTSQFECVRVSDDVELTGFSVDQLDATAGNSVSINRELG